MTEDGYIKFSGGEVLPYYLNLTTNDLSGNRMVYIYEIILTNNNTEGDKINLDRATREIRAFDARYKHFIAKSIFIVSWWGLPSVTSNNEQYLQMTLVTDGYDTFLVAYYAYVTTQAEVVAYKDYKGCLSYNYASKSLSKYLDILTNSGIKKQLIFRLTPDNCEKSCKYFYLLPNRQKPSSKLAKQRQYHVNLNLVLTLLFLL